MNKINVRGDPAGAFSGNGWKDSSVPQPPLVSMKQRGPYSMPEDETCSVWISPNASLPTPPTDEI